MINLFIMNTKLLLVDNYLKNSTSKNNQKKENLMNLSDYISKEKYIDKKHIIFLRHAPIRIKKLIKNNGNIKEYTSIQPENYKYGLGLNFHREKDKYKKGKILVVIEHNGIDKISAIYEIGEKADIGTRKELAGGCKDFYKKEKKEGWESEECLKFDLKPTSDLNLIGKAISGWEGRERTIVQRLGGGFFDKVQLTGD